MVNSKIKGVNQFGVEGYHIPKYNAYFDEPLGRKWIKGKVPDFWDAVRKRALKTPSPDHYQKNVNMMGKKGKIFVSKLPRTTEIDMIFKNKKSGPSPFSYNPKPARSKKALFNSKLERNGFIEDAKARGKDSPSPYNAKFTQVKPRLQGRSFLPTKKTNMDPIK